MPGKFLLDTNIVIALFAEDEGVMTQMSRASEVYLCPFVPGELFAGARKSGRVAANLKRIEEFESDNTTLLCDAGTARTFGVVKNQLRASGQPIPETTCGLRPSRCKTI